MNTEPEKIKKPTGPKPLTASRRERRGLRITDDCFAWTQSVESAGTIVQLLYEDDAMRAMIEVFVKKRLAEINPGGKDNAAS